MASNVFAQKQPDYYITIDPLSPDATLYTNVGRNSTISFSVRWSFGDNIGNRVPNATVTVQVSNGNKNMELITVNSSNTGQINFNYSSLEPAILTFTPFKVTTEDGKEWSSQSIELANNIYGLQAKPVTVWWDTFDAKLVSFSTRSLNEASVTVNITYFLLPEEGLNLPEGASYSNETYLPKAAKNATVTINGINAQETADAGVFTANIPVWLPTVYAYVEVSQIGWNTKDAGFSFTQESNQTVWSYTLLFTIGFAIAGLLAYGFLFKKANNPLMFKQQNYPFFGGVLLAIASFMNLYWVLVYVDGFLHGFDWLMFSFLGIVAFTLGISGAAMCFKRKYLAFVIFSTILPALSAVAIQNSMTTYQIASPLLIIAATLAIVIASGILMCNSEKYFSSQYQRDKL